MNPKFFNTTMARPMNPANLAGWMMMPLDPR